MKCGHTRDVEWRVTEQAGGTYFSIRARPRSPAGLRGFISPRSPSYTPPLTLGRYRRYHRRSEMRTAQTHNYSPRARIEKWGLLAERTVSSLPRSHSFLSITLRFSVFVYFIIYLWNHCRNPNDSAYTCMVLSKPYLHLEEVIRAFSPSVFLPLSPSFSVLL